MNVFCYQVLETLEEEKKERKRRGHRAGQSVQTAKRDKIKSNKQKRSMPVVARAVDKLTRTAIVVNRSDNKPTVSRVLQSDMKVFSVANRNGQNGACDLLYYSRSA